MTNQEVLVAESDDKELTLRKRALQLKLEDSLTDTIHIAIDEIRERMDNGDYKRDPRTGEIFRLPVSMKEIASTLAIIYDKRALIRGEATSIKAESKASLQSLKESFEQFALQMKEKEVVSVQNANTEPNHSQNV